MRLKLANGESTNKAKIINSKDQFKYNCFLLFCYSPNIHANERYVRLKLCNFCCPRQQIHWTVLCFVLKYIKTRVLCLFIISITNKTLYALYLNSSLLCYKENKPLNSILHCPCMTIISNSFFKIQFSSEIVIFIFSSMHGP